MGALYSFLESNGHGPVLPDAAVRRLYVRVGRSSAHRSQALGHPSWLRRLGGLYGPRGTNDCPVPSAPSVRSGAASCRTFSAPMCGSEAERRRCHSMGVH